MYTRQLEALLPQKVAILAAVTFFLWADAVTAGVVFRFVATDVLSPPGGVPQILSPFSGEIEFSEKSVSAGQATLDDVISVDIRTGVLLSNKDHIFDPSDPHWAFFSADGSTITRFWTESVRLQETWDAWFFRADNLSNGEVEVSADLLFPAGFVAGSGSPGIDWAEIQGFWTSQPGAVESFPILPVNEVHPFQFDMTVSEDELLGLDIPLFFDPVIAVGYEYEVSHDGLAFASVTMPSSVPDPDGFELHIWNGEDYVAYGSMMPGESFDFQDVFPDGVFRFKITGIDLGLSLDPADPLAFPTGLTFVQPGRVSFSMTPVVTMVPVPSLWLLTGIGMLGITLSCRRRITSTHSRIADMMV